MIAAVMNVVRTLHLNLTSVRIKEVENFSGLRLASLGKICQLGT